MYERRNYLQPATHDGAAREAAGAPRLARRLSHATLVAQEGNEQNLQKVKKYKKSLKKKKKTTNII